MGPKSSKQAKTNTNGNGKGSNRLSDPNNSKKEDKNIGGINNIKERDVLENNKDNHNEHHDKQYDGNDQEENSNKSNDNNEYDNYFCNKNKNADDQNYYVHTNNCQVYESASCSSDIDLDIKEELMQYKLSLVHNNQPKNKQKCKKVADRDTYRSNSFSLSKNTLTLIENEMSLDKGSYNYDQVDLTKEGHNDSRNAINITSQFNKTNKSSTQQLNQETDLNNENNKTDYIIKELPKEEEEIKSSHISKIICSKLSSSSITSTNNNNQPLFSSNTKDSTVIIFDWDDTLLCTTFLTPDGEFDSDIKFDSEDEEKISKIEFSVLKILAQSLQNGETFIITNSVPGWVQYSAKRFYPSVEPLLDRITIISARGEYEKIYPGDSRMWKMKAFLDMHKMIDANVKSNIICIGDSFIEVEAAKALKAHFNKAKIKSVKFRAVPKLEELNKQLSLLSDNMKNILSIDRSVVMTVEKRQKKTNT